MADAFKRAAYDRRFCTCCSPTPARRTMRREGRRRLKVETRAEIEQGIEEHENNVIEAADVCGRSDCWCAR